MNDLDLSDALDFNMDEVDDMPQFVNQIEGVYSCSLNLKRETDEDKDNLMLIFKIIEPVEERVDHGIKPDDLVTVRYGLRLTDKDKEMGNKQSFGLKLAKPVLIALKDALGTSASMEDIINNAQGVDCTVTFATKASNVKQDDGSVKTYYNINIRKLIVA